MKKILMCLLVCSLTCFCVMFMGNAKAETETSDEINESAYYELQENELVQIINNSFIAYNCYTYAIEREEQNEAKDPGDFSGFTYDIETVTVSRLAQLIKNDLEALGFQSVYISLTCPVNISNLKVICVRKGYDATNDFYDYHIMKLDNGAWYHKPGKESILKYKYQPTANLDWKNEYVNKYGSASFTNMIYSGDIYYISYYPTTYNITNNYCEIANYDELKYAMKYHTANNFKLKLTSNIVAPTIVVGPDSPSEILFKQWEAAEPFYGEFDGANYRIEKLNIKADKDINDDEYPYVGFISKNYGTIKNLTIRDTAFNIIPPNVPLNDIEPNFDAYINIGGIAAINYGTIENCTVGDPNDNYNVSIFSRYITKAGGICGINNNLITDCGVTNLETVVFGCFGLIAGENNGVINGCGVGGSNPSVFFGEMGGIAGTNSNKITDCNINGVIISCYDGYPDIYDNLYPYDETNPNTLIHYVRAGGITGDNKNGVVEYCQLIDVDVMCNAGVVNGIIGTQFMPEMGIICGRSNVDISTNNIKIYCSVSATNLNTNQSQYLGNRDVGRLI